MRDQSSYAWAGAQGNLGSALLSLGERHADRHLLRQSIEASSAALTVWDERQAATDWVMAQSNLGRALRALGEAEGDRALLEEAVARFQIALKARTNAPAIAERISDNLSEVLQILEKTKPAL